ncbi:MAG: zf-HC2 domain-containing protein [Gemmatimonadetes bacterium]|nr:zf-HC2 domain-containing protein [Gemmatimonadota bacterium]
MISCQEVITELWDYLDGELPAERAAAIADHLAECARCYPQYRFEYAFLAAVARQRAQGPGPSEALVEKVAGAVLATTSAAPAPRPAPARAALEERRPTPRAAAPLPPRSPSMGSRARAERWALAILRASLGVFLLLGIGRLAVSAEPAAVSSSLLSVVATLEGVFAAFIVIGVWRRWSYGAALLVHVGSLLLFWGQLRDPWGVALAGLPVCGALVTLYLLRDRDAWALDVWLAMRRPWRVVR